MLSFKDYIVEQDYIDWDYVFGFILEEEDEPSFKVEKDDEGTERHTHIFTIPKITGKGKHRVEVNVDKFGKEHMAEFTVDDSTNIEDSKKISGQIRMKILRGVAKALTSYARKNVKPGHSIYAGTYDVDYDNEKRKYGTQGRFFKGLAGQLGGEYSDFGGVHSVNMPRRRKVVKAV